MLILFAAAALLAPPADSLTAPAVDEIVVVAERVRRLKIVTERDRKTGLPRCVVKRSSGDPAFDSRICEAGMACAETVRTGPQMEACLRPHFEAYARELHERAPASGAATTP